MIIRPQEPKPDPQLIRAREQLQHLLVSDIAAEKQCRNDFNEDLIQGLMASIVEVGLLQPIRVRRNEQLGGKPYVIIDGECRWRAHCKLGLLTIAAIVDEDDAIDSELALKQLISNCQRADLTAPEKGAAIAWLMQETGWTAGEVAQKIGNSTAMATKFLAVLSLPSEIQKLVSDGQIRASAAYELARIRDPQQRSELVQKLITGELTRDELAGIGKKSRQLDSPKTPPSTNRAMAVLGFGQSVTVASPDLDMDLFIDLVAELLKKAKQARSQGVELPTFIAILKDQNQPSKTTESA